MVDISIHALRKESDSAIGRRNIFGICVAFPTTALSHTPWSLRESTHPSYISRRGISASRTTPYLSL